MTEARTIAVVRDYPELIAALRARAEELNVSRTNLDDISGLQSGYASKLLANPPIKTLGSVSLGPLIGSLGLAIALVEDPEQLRRIASRLEERNIAQVRVHAIASNDLPKWLFTTRKARKAAIKRWSNLTNAQKKRAAVKGWKTRRRRRRIARSKRQAAASAAAESLAR